MFRSSIQLYRYAGNNIKRHYAPRIRGANPGINRQLKVFKDGQTHPMEDSEDFDDMESDFMNVHKTHKESDAEYREYQESIQLKIVKNKYFKQKLPNFITYGEKDQIRFLHSKDPKEWTWEKLAESFPADATTIQKIVKAKWIPRSEKRIRIHDEKVIENWNLLKKGKFPELDPEFLEKLQQFAHRTKEDLKNIPTDPNIHTVLPKPKRQDFLSLITSCKNNTDDSNLLESGQREVQVNEKTRNPFASVNRNRRSNQTDDEETYLSDKIINKRQMRFQDLLPNKIVPEMSETYNSDKFKINVVNKTSTSDNEIFIKQFQSKEVIISPEDMEKFNVTKIKDRIHIPRKLWKKDATYKVEDCYYDYDGEFLYRVPGMTNN